MPRKPRPVLFVLFGTQGAYSLALMCVAMARWGLFVALFALAVCVLVIILGNVWLAVICRLDHNPTPVMGCCGLAIGVCVVATALGLGREFRLAELSGGDAALRLELERILPLQRVASRVLLCTLVMTCLGWIPLARWAARSPLQLTRSGRAASVPPARSGRRAPRGWARPG